MRGRIKIFTEICKGCSYCIEACPYGVIGIRKRFNKSGFFPAVVLHMERCTGCAMCAHMCPDVAIEVFRNSKKPTRISPKAKERKRKKPSS